MCYFNNVYVILGLYLIFADIGIAVRQPTLNFVDIEQDASAIETAAEAQQDYVDLIPPGDYPAYREIPQTSFSCLGKLNWHYYADLEAGCQVFHVCETQFSKISFLCPIGSVFNQRHLVCDWWYNVDCHSDFSFYNINNGLNIEDDILKVNAVYDEDGRFDLSIGSSGDVRDREEHKSKKNDRESEKENRNKSENSQAPQNVVVKRRRQ